MTLQLDLLPLAYVAQAPPRDAATAPLFDFRTDGPPRPRCAVCKEHFEDWAVADEDWRTIPAMYWPCHLCKRDYTQLLRESGHDPKVVSISDEPWEKRVALWEPTKDMPPDHVHVLFNARRGRDREIREAKVIRQVDHVVHLVRVFKNTPGKRPRGKGTAYLATWSDLICDRSSGRPIMVALGRPRLPKARGPEWLSSKRMAVAMAILAPYAAQKPERAPWPGKLEEPSGTTTGAAGSMAAA